MIPDFQLLNATGFPFIVRKTEILTESESILIFPLSAWLNICVFYF